ncbi:hypothetical protein NDU88_009079 [Pleurodeles waltl]|uniref:Uncharacterized protein n=1 Tax=Pleurodeles waltl TaxID=8319 RepID=A0AAV7P155_PLEWA|nr:hypothetical protein NDU88_009079 [Pleurodeles waltl]
MKAGPPSSLAGCNLRSGRSCCCARAPCLHRRPSLRPGVQRGVRLRGRLRPGPRGAGESRRRDEGLHRRIWFDSV